MNEWPKARTLAKAYAIEAWKEATALDVIVGNFSPFNINVYALIDLGSTHSYISNALVDTKNFLVVSTDYTVKAMNPLG